ncbi:c-type cytochrome [Flavilitoribacter nigricans]|uniref:Cytochrome C n=1 Tax=Flavilitoribacter nigricans (strain ATCC 23147 / DSM 23189 / NBRC 102662 / NCIMB 1420 / SS-2) TaxID=1122177 RepID=A0A2D0MZ80_FLAN2|nr:c-type cytochrome [Flavilitoribacter nigricans]PHN01584.1 cytochrome C [Flavilitoribacter nigricans DSM 23189 = NBRC 102662]
MLKYVFFLYFFFGLFLGILGACAYFSFFREPTVVQPVAESSWHLKSIDTDLPAGDEGARIKYGFILITKTSEYIGPLAKEDKMRFAGNNLACNNCHLNGGRKIGSGSFVGVYNRFPQFRGRENKIGTLEERINGCMERSMSGSKMPEDSEEMQAIISYMKWLSDGVPPDIEKKFKGYLPIKIPTFKADTTVGRQLYQTHCVVCHQEDGSGVAIPGKTFSGYVYPPVGGQDSYNNGAGMNRVLTAAQFIKYNMPFGTTHDNPVLTDEEAYHIAAYINTFDRPEKPNLEADFPDKKLKPVSTPYGPWTDEFDPDQHKFGPFPPIIAYYKEKFDLKKSK